MGAKIILFFVITIAGQFPLHLLSTLVRKYTIRTFNRPFLRAQELCRKTFFDLATIDNVLENSVVRDLGNHFGAYVWIGLYDNMSSWTWSMNEAVFDNGTDFNNWDGLEPQLTIVSKICVYMTPEGWWHDELCTEELPALCYYEPGPAKYILVTMPMTWERAQLYCRSNYTDLVSVRNMTENNDVWFLVTSPTWIGLYRQGWGQWSDQTPLTFNNFRTQDMIQTSSTPLNCARMHTPTGVWSQHNCATQYDYVCEVYVEASTTVGSAQTSTQGPDMPSPGSSTFSLKLQSDTDLNDPSVQGQILQQLQTNLENGGLPDFKLSWVQTNRQVLHKETSEE